MYWWSDPAVQSAVIGAAGSVAAAVAAGILTVIIGRQTANRKRLEAKLQMAVKDIHFLLLVEQAHCELHQSREGESNKLRVRGLVREQGASWSGKFTPGRSNQGVITLKD